MDEFWVKLVQLLDLLHCKLLVIYLTINLCIHNESIHVFIQMTEMTCTLIVYTCSSCIYIYIYITSKHKSQPLKYKCCSNSCGNKKQTFLSKWYENSTFVKYLSQHKNILNFYTTSMYSKQ